MGTNCECHTKLPLSELCLDSVQLKDLQILMHMHSNVQQKSSSMNG